MPGESRVVQTIVDAGEVGRLAAVDMERGDRFQPGRFDPPPGPQQVNRVGDQARVLVGAEVATLGVERRTITRFVAPVLLQIQHYNIDRPVRERGVAWVPDQHPIRLQPIRVQHLGPTQKTRIQFGRHLHGIRCPVEGVIG